MAEQVEKQARDVHPAYFAFLWNAGILVFGGLVVTAFPTLPFLAYYYFTHGFEQAPPEFVFRSFQIVQAVLVALFGSMIVRRYFPGRFQTDMRRAMQWISGMALGMSLFLGAFALFAALTTYGEVSFRMAIVFLVLWAANTLPFIHFSRSSFRKCVRSLGDAAREACDTVSNLTRAGSTRLRNLAG